MQHRTGLKCRRKASRHKRAMLLLAACAVPVLFIYASHNTAASRETSAVHLPAQTLPAAAQSALPQQHSALREPPISTSPAIPPQSPAVDDWRLILVNPWNGIPADYAVELTELLNGHAIDSRAYPDLQQMMDDCRAAGLSPLICSSYRSMEKQSSLFENKVYRLMAEGYNFDAARAEASKVVAVPGTSEHQTALALDIVDLTNQNLDETQEHTGVQQWLMAHSWEYGFVLRYPNGKSDITGIIYEPWHYRYVGREAAKEMTELGLCLEEYVELLSGDNRP
ncbi:MAG: M15 family metallopeptidase [Candidatus Fimadaptatus sp.]|jgi:D-alanyl-D-alanine carboxypeptidase